MALNYLIASSGSAVYAIDLTDVTQPPFKLCDVARPISGVQYGNSFFFVDGVKYREYKPEFDVETGEFKHSVYEIKKDVTSADSTSLYYDETSVRYKPSTEEEGFPYKGPNNVGAVNNATQIAIQYTYLLYWNNKQQLSREEFSLYDRH